MAGISHVSSMIPESNVTEKLINGTIRVDLTRSRSEKKKKRLEDDIPR